MNNIEKHLIKTRLFAFISDYVVCCIISIILFCIFDISNTLPFPVSPTIGFDIIFFYIPFHFLFFPIYLYCTIFDPDVLMFDKNFPMILSIILFIYLIFFEVILDFDMKYKRGLRLISLKDSKNLQIKIKIKRAILKIFTIHFFLVIDVICFFTTENHQTIYDLICGMVVIEKNNNEQQ